MSAPSLERAVELAPSLDGLARRVARIERFAALFAKIDRADIRSALWGTRAHQSGSGTWAALYALLDAGTEFAALVRDLDALGGSTGDDGPADGAGGGR